MRKGWEWLVIAIRGGRLAEIAAASGSLDASAIRRTRRLVRKGQAAGTPATARLAVALARRTQRRYSVGGLAVLLVIAAVAIGFAVKRFENHGAGAAVISFAAFGIWACWISLRSWHLDGKARQAELVNMQLLVDAGEPYPGRPPTGVLPISAPAQAIRTVFTWLLYDLSYGAVTLAFDEQAISLGRVVGRGAVWATLMVVFVVLFSPGQRDRQSEKSTIGQRGNRA